MNDMLIKGKKIYIKKINRFDYLSWKNAYSQANQKPLNEFDVCFGKELTELTYKKYLTRLKIHRAGIAKKTTYGFGIFLKNGRLIGWIYIWGIKRSVLQSGHLSYSLFQNYWGQGLASEALGLIIRFAFHQLKLHRLEANIAKKNKRSTRLVEKFNFKKEGFNYQYVYDNGKWNDVMMYALINKKFKFP